MINMNEVKLQVIQRLLREAKKKSKKSDEEPEKEIKTINVKVGDREWDNFPESESRRIISLIRQIVKGTVASAAVIDDLLLSVPEAKREKLRKVLEEIEKEKGAVAISSIPDSFPFLEAEGGEEFDYSGLDEESLALLNTEQGTTGRGEIAIALLFGVEEFLTPEEKGEKNRPSVSSYDLVYRGKKCDVKDSRSFLKDNKIKMDNYVRLGTVTSSKIERAINSYMTSEGIESSAIKFFVNQSGPQSVIFNHFLLKKPKTPDEMVEVARSFLRKILDDCNKIVAEALAEEYDGGIFIIDGAVQKIKLYSPDDFDIYALKVDHRCSISYKRPSPNVSYFEAGVMSYFEKNKEALFRYIPRIPVARDQDEEPEVEDDPGVEPEEPVDEPEEPSLS